MINVKKEVYSGLHECFSLCLLTNSSQATSQVGREEQVQIALALQRGLEGLDKQSNRESEPEPPSEHDSEENSFDLPPVVQVVQQKASESNFRVR